MRAAGYLKADYENGKGEVKLSDKFKRLPAQTRLNIMLDWNGFLETELTLIDAEIEKASAVDPADPSNLPEPQAPSIY